MLQNLSKDTLHHTNICVGDRTKIIQDIDLLISQFSKDIKHIERLVYEYDKFLLNDVKHIVSSHLHKVALDEMQIICIAFNSTNLESQNSILKILEEPPKRTYFFLIIPNKKIMLPTVLSRAQLFEYTKEITISKETQQFISASIAQRLEKIKKMLDDLKSEKITKQHIIEFIEEIEKHVHQKKNIVLVKRIIEIKGYFKEQGASAKQLLEYLAVQI
jgi:DNA polymerase III delta prime subunit